MNRSISVPDDLDARVEKARGDVPRSVFWVRAMERAFGDATGDRIPERPAPPRSSKPKASKRPDTALEAAASLDRMARAEGLPTHAELKASNAAALARQQALNKPKGI